MDKNVEFKTNWKRTVIFFPRKCIFTKKLIWPWQKVMHGTRVMHYAGGVKLIGERWTTHEQLTIETLKGGAR